MTRAHLNRARCGPQPRARAQVSFCHRRPTLLRAKRAKAEQKRRRLIVSARARPNHQRALARLLLDRSLGYRRVVEGGRSIVRARARVLRSKATPRAPLRRCRPAAAVAAAAARMARATCQRRLARRRSLFAAASFGVVRWRALCCRVCSRHARCARALTTLETRSATAVGAFLINCNLNASASASARRGRFAAWPVRVGASASRVNGTIALAVFAVGGSARLLKSTPFAAAAVVVVAAAAVVVAAARAMARRRARGRAPTSNCKRRVAQAATNLQR